MVEYTEHRHYPKPTVDDEPFIDVMHTFADMVDADIDGFVDVPGFIVPAWATVTSYAINDKVVDLVTGAMFNALVSHTSGASTFAADRAAHPTYWQSFGVVMNPRGAWAQATSYAVLDFVYNTSEGVSALCVTAHTSTATGTIRTDAVKWVFIVDLQGTFPDAEVGQVILAGQVFGG